MTRQHSEQYNKMRWQGYIKKKKAFPMHLQICSVSETSGNFAQIFCRIWMQTEQVFSRRSVYGARRGSGVFSRASRLWRLWHAQRREPVCERTLCFEKGGPLPRTIHTSSSLAVWISGTQISLNICGMSCFCEVRFTQSSTEKMNLI